MTLPDGFILRSANNEDAGAIRGLIVGVLHSYGLSPDPATTDADLGDIERNYYQHGGTLDVLVESASQRIVGTVGLWPIDIQTVELRKMYLDGAYRGRGLSRALLDHALAKACRRGFRRMTLETASVLQEALALYTRYGFTTYDTDHLAERCDIAMELVLPDLLSDYTIGEGYATMDFARVTGWLAGSYWSPGIAREMVERGARHSALVIGAFMTDGTQVGFARVVSDCTRHAYLADVIVDGAHRGKGIGRAMIRYALTHPELATVKRWVLATADAQAVYAPLGFVPLMEPENKPERWMIRHTAHWQKATH